MLKEVNEAKQFLINKFGDVSSVVPGVYAIPTQTSKGDAFMKVTITEDGSMKDFDLYWDEQLTHSWYNEKPIVAKTKEEILAPFIERPLRHTEVVDKDNALKAMEIFAKQIWDMACAAQMNAVYDHCSHSPQGTNGHAIKFWVKPAPYPATL